MQYACKHSHISHDPPRVPHFSNNLSACPLAWSQTTHFWSQPLNWLPLCRIWYTTPLKAPLFVNKCRLELPSSCTSKNAAPPPVPTYDLVPTTMFATSVPSQDSSCWLRLSHWEWTYGVYYRRVLPYWDWRPEESYTTKASHGYSKGCWSSLSTCGRWVPLMSHDVKYCGLVHYIFSPTTPILSSPSQLTLWLNISDPWEIVFQKLQTNLILQSPSSVSFQVNLLTSIST